MPTIQFVLNFLRDTSLPETVQYLLQLPECENQNETSVRSVVLRQKSKVESLKKSAGRPKGKADLDDVLQSSFPFPPKDESQREKAT